MLLFFHRLFAPPRKGNPENLRKHKEWLQIHLKKHCHSHKDIVTVAFFTTQACFSQHVPQTSFDTDRGKPVLHVSMPQMSLQTSGAQTGGRKASIPRTAALKAAIWDWSHLYKVQEVDCYNEITSQKNIFLLYQVGINTFQAKLPLIDKNPWRH